jgi:hypothetical protein
LITCKTKITNYTLEQFIKRSILIKSENYGRWDDDSGDCSSFLCLKHANELGASKEDLIPLLNKSHPPLCCFPNCKYKSRFILHINIYESFYNFSQLKTQQLYKNEDNTYAEEN